jgi:purine-binding chemotaxis protein CheW
MVEAMPHSSDMLMTRVGAMTFALPVAHVVETMRPLPTERVEGTPASVRGHAVLRGVEIPVVELAHVLGTATTASSRDSTPAMRFVVVRAGDRLVALAVDAVLGVGPLTAIGEGKLLDSADHTAVSALGALDAGLLAVLDASRVLSAVVR